MIPVNCWGCKKEILKHPYIIKRNKRFFCSFECRKGVKLKSPEEYPLCQQCKERRIKPRAGRFVRFCSSKCFGAFARGDYIIKKGYKKIIHPNHHRADSKGYVREHILVMEKKLGRPIKYPEVIHHIDGNKLNNNPDNLQLCKNNSEHIKIHRKRNQSTC